MTGETAATRRTSGAIGRVTVATLIAMRVQIDREDLDPKLASVLLAGRSGEAIGLTADLAVWCLCVLPHLECSDVGS